MKDERDEQEQQPKVADFISLLVDMNRGNTVIECGRMLQELTDAIVDTGGKGKLVLTLDVVPSGLKKGRINQFEVHPDIKISKPLHDQGKAIFFIAANGALTRQNPDQMDMEFEEREHGNARR